MTLSETARAGDPHDGTSYVPPAAFVSTAFAAEHAPTGKIHRFDDSCLAEQDICTASYTVIRSPKR